jgi:hypothetical protein
MIGEVGKFYLATNKKGCQSIIIPVREGRNWHDGSHGVFVIIYHDDQKAAAFGRIAFHHIKNNDISTCGGENIREISKDDIIFDCFLPKKFDFPVPMDKILKSKSGSYVRLIAGNINESIDSRQPVAYIGLVKSRFCKYAAPCFFDKDGNHLATGGADNLDINIDELEIDKMKTVKNIKEQEIDFQAALNIMDDDLREELASLGLETEQEFFEVYAVAHKARFGEDFAPWVDLPW